MTVAELFWETITEISGAFSAKKARTDSRLISGPYARHQSGQFGEAVNAMIGHDAEFIHLGTQRPKHRQWRQRLAFEAGQRHRLRRHPLDPGDIKPERLGAAGVPGIGRDEQHLGGRYVQHLLDQHVGFGARLENVFYGPAVDPLSALGAAAV